jgi:hypothetical protein
VDTCVEGAGNRPNQIEPERIGVGSERLGRVVYAVPVEPVPTMSVEQVNEILDALRNRG